jgi:hypothetical protein
MEFNLVATGIELIGTTVRVLNIENNIVDVEREAKRSFNLNINEPQFEKLENEFLSQMIIDFKVEIEQSERQKCKIEMSLEGAFLSGQSVDEAAFKQLVVVNGAAAIIGIARGKIETISANVFNNGKIVIPFVNVADYYKSLSE